MGRKMRQLSKADAIKMAIAKAKAAAALEAKCNRKQHKCKLGAGCHFIK